MSIISDALFAAQFLDKGGAVFNVRHPDFGAAGDGVADDGIAWNKTRAAVSANGGAVLVPPGSYLLTTAFTFASATNVLLILSSGVVLTGSALPTPTGTNAILDLRAGTGKFTGTFEVDQTIIAETATGQAGLFKITRAGVLRWQAGWADSPDSWVVFRYNDAGSFLGKALDIDRTTGNATFEGDLVLSKDTTALIRQNTADAADSSRVILAGGGGSSTTRGASIALAGNEFGGGEEGTVNIFGGLASADGGIKLWTNGLLRLSINFAGLVTLSSGLVVTTGPIIHALVTTLADDGTPSVSAGDLFKTGGTTTITDFDDGVVGQTIRILAAHAVTITDGSPIILAGGVDYVMGDSDTLTLTMFNDQVWNEVSRSVN